MPAFTVSDGAATTAAEATGRSPAHAAVIPTVHNTVPDIVRQMSAVGYEGTIGRGAVPPTLMGGTVSGINTGGTIGRQNSYLNTVGRRTSASV